MTTLSAVWQSINWTAPFWAGVYIGFCAGAAIVFSWWLWSDAQTNPPPRWDERNEWEGKR